MLRRVVSTGAALAAVLTVGGTLFNKYRQSVTQNFFYSQQILKYAQKYYKNLIIPQEILEQLSLTQGNPRSTCESNVRIKVDTDAYLHKDVKRSLSQWNCLKLLQKNDKQAHEEFIISQPLNDKLTFPTFQKIAAIINKQSVSAQDALQASCFIVYTDRARERAERVQPDIKFSKDSEKFITDVMTHCPQIYPIWKTLNPLAQKFLIAAFLKDSHARHMMLSEGGKNMIAELRARIKSKSLSEEEFQVWFARWIINNTGFRGHEDPRGSLYLTESVAQEMLALYEALNKFRENPDLDPEVEYLRTRAKWLGTASLYLAHIASALRIHDADSLWASELKSWFRGHRAETQKEEEAYWESYETMTLTPTYEPAVLDNLLALGRSDVNSKEEKNEESLSIAMVMEIYSMIRKSLLVAYKQAMDQGIITSDTPLSFRLIGFKDNLKPIVALYKDIVYDNPLKSREELYDLFKERFAPEVDDKGDVRAHIVPAPALRLTA